MSFDVSIRGERFGIRFVKHENSILGASYAKLLALI